MYVNSMALCDGDLMLFNTLPISHKSDGPGWRTDVADGDGGDDDTDGDGDSDGADDGDGECDGNEDDTS